MRRYHPLDADEVVVCPHWRDTCGDTEPQPRIYTDFREPPLCDNDHPMTVVMSMRAWRAVHGWR